MKKLITAFLMLLLVSVCANAQNFSKEYGNVSEEELQMTSYAPDKDAEALVLYDKGKIYFDQTGTETFQIIYERSTRIKILTEDGLNWAEIKIPYYTERNIYELIYELEAYTYNYENGTVIKTKLDLENNVVDERIDDFWTAKKLLLPLVKKGSVIEYKYKLRSANLIHLRDWEFQWEIPVLSSECELKMTPVYAYKWVLQGVQKLHYFNTFDDRSSERNFGTSGAYQEHKYYDKVYQFALKDVPAFKGEKFISSKSDYIAKIDFQLEKIFNLSTGVYTEMITTWPKMLKELRKDVNFGLYLLRSKRVAAKTIDKKRISSMNPMDRFNYVIDFIKENYEFNQSIDKFTAKSINQFVKDKKGNLAEINLFAVGMLNAVGLEAYPVLISTRSHGKIKYDYPFIDHFNGVVIAVKVDGEFILSDATDKFLMNDRLPVFALNEKGLLYNHKEIKWFHLQGRHQVQENIAIEAHLKEGQADLNLEKSFTEYAAASHRKEIGADIALLGKKLRNNGYSVNESSIKIEDALDKTKKYAYSFHSELPLLIKDDKIYLMPFFNEIEKEALLKEKRRDFPVDLIYAQSKKIQSKLILPEGYTPEKLPNKASIKNELFEMDYSVELNNQELTVNLSYWFKEFIYQSKEYNKIKYYFEEIAKKGNETIVLVKKP